jgi:1-acyl-sn-glycerol-3-phosphate acyltransferase
MNMMIFRNFLFYLGIMPTAFLVSILALLFFYLPYRFRYPLITSWSHFFIFWAKVTCGLKYKVTGRENIPSENAIVVANHQSTWETIFFQVLLPPQCWVLKKELLYIPCFGWGLAMLEPIAIKRAELNSIKTLLKEGIKRLRAGRWIVVFPEGTRVAVGESQRFSRTAAALAHASKKPVLPIAHNAGEFWPRGMMIQKPGTIQVAIGPVIDPKGKSATEINDLAEQWIKNTMEDIAR